jgi:pimeloyl-ACP methyl ester carboxylesterase
MITHDWGAMWGYHIVHRMPGRLEKLVALDVGASSSGEDRAIPHLLLEVPTGIAWWIPYQLFLASVFATGNLVSPNLAGTLLDALMPFFVQGPAGPLQPGFDMAAQAPRPMHEVKWWMGYPYYQLWVGLLLRGRPPPSMLFPSMPTLFVYGERKRAMFHSEAFVTRINSTIGYRAASYPCSHWIMHEQPARLNLDIRAFLDGQ